MIRSISRLQREFGLPFHAAEAVFRNQMARAHQRYRHWHVPVGVGIVVVPACNFAPDHSLYFHAGHVILHVSCVYLGIRQILTYRRAQPLIRTAAATVAAAHCN